MMTENDRKPRIISGITSTGRLTLGNYIGAIKNFIKLQEENELLIFVANLHAITIPISQTELHTNTRNIIALYYACGLDPAKSTIFLQSDVLEHTLLGHILLCNTTVGELSRMTQYKDKSSKMRAENGTEFIPTGLLTYPPLMAADILLYDADLVPVGADQKQHIELTRNIAERMNNKYGSKLFKIPEEFIPPVGGRIMDLQEPTKKMSKSSSNPKSYIGLLDSPKEIKQKIKQAVTDSEGKIYYDVENKPGISNLITIYSSLKNKSITEAVNELENLNYGQLKELIADEIIKELSPIQEKYHTIINSNELDKIISEGAKKAKEIASKKIEQVKNAIGLNI